MVSSVISSLLPPYLKPRMVLNSDKFRDSIVKISFLSPLSLRITVPAPLPNMVLPIIKFLL